MQEIVKILARDLVPGQMNFIPLLPADDENLVISVRNEGERWASLVFRESHEGHILRTKEFFMDWFCPGFPKSLMISFVDAYSPILADQLHGTTTFYGKNYRGRDSLTFYSRGTTVEIESESPCDPDILISYARKLNFPENGWNDISRSDFYRRSFLCRNHGGDWFEDLRVSRLHWSKLNNEINVQGKILKGSGIGFTGNSPVDHFIAVFEDTSHDIAVWAEFLRQGSDLEHGSYSLRKGRYLYTDYEIGESGVTSCFRTQTGPAVFQWNDSLGKYTVMLSPGIDPLTFKDEELNVVMKPVYDQILS